MRKFDTSKFLNKKPLSSIEEGDKTQYNAEKAEKHLGIPKQLWFKLSEKALNSLLLEELFKSNQPNSLFMAGVAVGWHEALNFNQNMETKNELHRPSKSPLRRTVKTERGS